MITLPRMIAPAGTPIKLTELLGWLSDSVTGKDRRADLCHAIGEKYAVKHCFLMSSGRAAMAMLFQILKEKNIDPARNEIVLPSYTCYSVPAAAEIAGLKIRICDIDPQTLSYDMQQFQSIDLSQVLCVVSANLYGYPDDLPKLELLTREAGCYLLDDAAQSMDAMVDDRYAGTFGDMGLYSLDKGKNITAIQGGIIVTNRDDIAQRIQTAVDQLPQAGFRQQLMDAIKLIAYVIMLRPGVYWIPAGIPALGLGKTLYTTDYLFSGFSRSMAALASRLFRRIDDISEQRRQRARTILQQLGSVDGLSTVAALDDSHRPVYLRVPVLLHDAQKKQPVLQALRKAGIGATGSYPESIADLPQLRGFSIVHNDCATGGRYVAEHIITLPSIAYMNDDDMQGIATVLAKYS